MCRCLCIEKINVSAWKDIVLGEKGQYIRKKRNRKCYIWLCLPFYIGNASSAYSGLEKESIKKQKCDFLSGNILRGDTVAFICHYVVCTLQQCAAHTDGKKVGNCIHFFPFKYRLNAKLSESIYTIYSICKHI